MPRPRHAVLVQRLVCILVTVLAAGLVAVAPAPAGSGIGVVDTRFGTDGRTTLDWTRPQPATLVGTSGPFVAAAVGDRFGLAQFSEFGGSTLGVDGTVTVGFGKPATARGIVDGALVVGSAGDDFGLVHFGTGGQTDLRFGSAGRLTIDFGSPAVAWDGLTTWDSYGWVIVGSAKPGSSRKLALARIDTSGNLVGSFGTGGKVLSDFGPGDDEARSITTDNEKNLIVAGRSGGSAIVARYTPSGALDTTFGTGGVVRLELSSGDDLVERILFNPYGYLVVAGQAGNRGFVTELGPDGSPNPAFGAGGTRLIDFGGTTSQVGDIARINGRTAVTGVTNRPTGSDAAVAELTATGALDPSFGSGGIVVADLGSPADEANGVLLRYSDGTLQVAGGNGQEAVLWGLTANGAPDTRLGPDGQKRLPFGGVSRELPQDAVVQPDGRVVVTGTAGSHLALARLTPDGQPDDTFGDGGYVLGDLGNVTPTALAVAPDGDIVVWGSRPCANTGEGCAFLARFQPDGDRDTTFGAGGAVEVFAAPGRRSSLLVQPDGDIVAVGSPGFGTGYPTPTFLGRWKPDGRPDPSFGTNGVAAPAADRGRGVVRTTAGQLAVLSHPDPFCCTAVSAYSADGRLVGFGGSSGGAIPTNFWGEFIASTPDGGFLLAGRSGATSTTQSATVLRLNQYGRVLTSFGTGGQVTITSDSGTRLAEDLEVLADGHILFAVSDFPRRYGDDAQNTIFGLTPQGQPDPSFGTGGSVVVPGSASSPLGLAVQSPDRLVVVTIGWHNDQTDMVVQAFTLEAVNLPTTTSGPPTTATTAPTPPTSSTSTTRPAAPSSTTSTTTSTPSTTTAPAGGSTAGTQPEPAPHASPARTGYWLVDAGGHVHPFGDAPHLGDAVSAVPVVDLEPTPTGRGYWILDEDGRVSAFGDATRLGDADRARFQAHERVTSLSATPTGAGYWIFTNRGRVVTVGDAVHLGDMASIALNGPVLDSIPTPSGRGYYMVASDGGIFAFGDAAFAGSMGGQRLNAPVQSLVPDPDASGYWLVASDGGVFAFDAPFKGSMGGTRLNRPMTGMIPYGDGYLMVAEDGGLFNFSNRPFSGSLGDRPPPQPVVAVAAPTSGPS